MHKSFLLTISAVDSVLYAGTAESLTAPGVDGEMTVLPEHVPLITALKQGALTVRNGGKEEKFSVEHGVLEIGRERVTVLVG